MSELKLYAFNQPLALSPNTRIRLRRVNPMFSQGRIQGTFSFPFQLPKKPNMQLLGFSHDVQISRPLTTISDGVRLEYAGESITGRLRLEDAGSFYECQFLADNGAAANELQNRKLTDTKFATEYQNITTAAGQQNRARNLAASVNSSGWPPVRPFVVFPFYNPNYFNKSEKAGGFYVANNFLDVNLEPTGQHRPMVDGDVGGPLLLLISNQVGQFIDGEIVTDGTRQGIVALHATKDANRLVVTQVTGGGWGGNTITGQTSGATALVNTQTINAPWTSGYYHAPAVYVLSIFQGLAKELGYEFVTELASDPEIMNLVLLTGKSINYELSITHAGTNPRFVSLLPEGFFLSEVLPDMTVAEFIEDFREFWGWVSYFDQQQQRFTLTSLRNLMQRPPDADWTSLAERVYNKEVPEDHAKPVALSMAVDETDELVPFKSIIGKRIVNTFTPPAGGYRSGDIGQMPNTDWNVIEQNLSLIYVPRFWSFDLGEQLVGDGTPTVKTSRFGIPAMRQDVAFDFTRRTRMPYFGAIGSMRGFNLSESNRQLPKLLFYRGLVNANPELEDYAIPYASTDEYDAALNDAFNYSVKFAGPKGRFKVWLSEYVDFMRNTFLVKRRINLPPGELLAFDITRKKVIEGSHYFIKHIDITLPYTQPAEAEMYKY